MTGNFRFLFGKMFQKSPETKILFVLCYRFMSSPLHRYSTGTCTVRSNTSSQLENLIRKRTSIQIKMIGIEEFYLNNNEKTLSMSMVYIYKHVSIIILSAESFQLLQSRLDPHPSDAFPDSILFMLSSKLGLKTLYHQHNNMLAHHYFYDVVRSPKCPYLLILVSCFRSSRGLSYAAISIFIVFRFGCLRVAPIHVHKNQYQICVCTK